jgi:HNH endonuclease
MTRKRIEPALRERVYLRWRGRCLACQKRITRKQAHCDHIVKVEDGGGNDISNLRCLCVKCHQLRHGGGHWIYGEQLGCGCCFYAWQLSPQTDAPLVVGTLRIEPQRRTYRQIHMNHCSRHRKMPWSEWHKLFRIRSPEKISAASLAIFRKFMCRVHG